MEKKKNIKSENPINAIILFASKSGNSKSVAKQMHKLLTSCNISASCCNISEFKIEDIYTISHLFISISTYGKGDPPGVAKPFFRELNNLNEDSLQKLNFSICALGNSKYKHFCQAGKDLDLLLEQKGACRIINRVDCDKNYKKPAEYWIKSTAKILKPNCIEEIENKDIAKIRTINSNFEGRVSCKNKMSENNSCFHIEIKGDNLKYQAGDCIEISPTNPSFLVNKLCSQMTNNQQEQIQIEKMLKYDYEITKLSESTIEKYNKINPSSEIKSLLADKKKLNDYIKVSNLLDLINDYPNNLRPINIVETLPKIEKRIYSISSSPKQHQNEIHLTVKTICCPQRKHTHLGAGSNFLNKELKINDKLHFSTIANEEFRLPEKNKTPIIMIGIGTGIAPFRAFMQERKDKKCKNWLIYGAKNQEKDLYYKNELLEAKENKNLKHLHLAFSQEKEKLHVQDLLREHKDKLYKWIKKGAHIYICGSKKLGEEVENIFKEILESKKDKYQLDSLVDQFRYHEDIY